MVGRMAYYAFALEEETSLDDLVRTATRLWANALKIDEAAS